MLRIQQTLNSALSTSYGWFLTVMTASITIIQPEAWSFGVVGFVILADLFWGVAAAVKLKKFILSTALRETVKKIGIYSFVMVSVLITERILHLDGSFVAVKVTAVFAAVCELWSMSASMLIIKPDMPFLRLFRLQLKGEIEAKMNKNVDFDEIFKEGENETNNQA